MISAAIALAIMATAVSAQQQTPTRYTTALYVKVQPGKAGAFREYYATGDGGKLIRAQMKANPKMLSWSLRQPMYGGSNGAGASHVMLTLWDGAPSFLEPAKRDEIYKATTGMTFTQTQEKLAGMREVVGSTISHLHDTVGQLEQGDYVVLQRYKTAPGRSDELNAMMHDVRLPMVTERIKGGGGLKYWAFTHLALAAGSSEAWDATISRAFKNLDGALGAGGGGAGGANANAAAAQFAKLFPTKSYTAYVNDFREYASLVRTDVHYIAVLIRP